jgi:hypothetical protein
VRRLRQALGGHEHNAAHARRDALQRLAFRAAAQCAIDQRAVDASGDQFVRQILHERDERRHNQGHAVQMQRRQLIAHRLDTLNCNWRPVVESVEEARRA